MSHVPIFPAFWPSQLRGAAPFRPVGPLRRRSHLSASPLPRKPTARAPSLRSWREAPALIYVPVRSALLVDAVVTEVFFGEFVTHVAADGLLLGVGEIHHDKAVDNGTEVGIDIEREELAVELEVLAE